MKGGKKITDRKAAWQLKHKTIHPSAKGKINNPTHKPRTFKNHSNTPTNVSIFLCWDTPVTIDICAGEEYTGRI